MKLKSKLNKSVFLRLLNKLREDDIFALGSQLAYSLLLAFFPFLIFLMTVIGFSSVTSSDVLFNLEKILPGPAYELISTTIVEIFDSQNSDLLSFSLLITIWVSSNGFYAVIKGLNKAYADNEERPFWKLRITSILCTFVLILMIIFSLLLLVLGNLLGIYLTRWLNLSSSFNLFWQILRYILTLISMVFTFAIIYILTPTRNLVLKQVLPGAVFATIGWILVSIGFAFYVDNFNNYSRVYGSIGAVIILMIWLFLSSVILLIGGEINSLYNDTKNKLTS
ncbi:YihY/virulence factor BrkB family protein [Clostridium ganghwense]|uniref:YihY/virulence factor BrkB family protein n=1 Tax=Clostridium ganghwense TaxID=312089 RepID=A0ABT4CRZ4_9CLOT|nr:YihY/virulence factor BrkB family protein [Clostridium ganghwense]MCY6370991.1 YihY/virulence factor BrkB family protein [Clostridium ganghwense]